MTSPTKWTWVWENSGDGEGQGRLVCCSPQGHKESDRTQWLNNNNDSFLPLSTWSSCLLPLNWNINSILPIDSAYMSEYPLNIRNCSILKEYMVINVRFLLSWSFYYKGKDWRSLSTWNHRKSFPTGLLKCLLTVVLT